MRRRRKYKPLVTSQSHAAACWGSGIACGGLWPSASGAALSRSDSYSAGALRHTGSARLAPCSATMLPTFSSRRCLKLPALVVDTR